MKKNHAAEMRRCLRECDAAGIRRLHHHISPHLPQPKTDHEALCGIHHARTQSEWMSLKDRAYSHRFLLDHGLPSGLPDELKPKAEQLCPKIVEGVGFAVKASSPLMIPVMGAVTLQVAERIADIYASNPHPDPVYVKRQMMEARDQSLKTILGITSRK